MDIALAPATRKWVVVTLVLALLYLPLTAVQFFQLPSNPLVLAGRGALMRELVIEQLVIAVAFLVGAVALLKGKLWAYTWLGYSALAALATVAIGAYIQFALRGDPAIVDAFVTATLKQSPQAASMPEEQLRGMAKTQAAFTFWFGMVVSAIQAAYCSLLYLHLSDGPRPPEG